MDRIILVFGATGHLGTHIAVHLSHLGYHVIAIGKRKNDNGFFASYGIPYYSIDICQKQSFGILPRRGVYAIFHFAGALPASMKGYHPEIYLSSVIDGTMNVLEYARTVHVDRIIFPQSLFDVSYLFGTKDPIPADSLRKAPVDGDHAIYVIAKNAAVDMIEHYYHRYGIKRFILRCSRVYMYDPNPFTYTDGKKTMVVDRLFIYQALQGKDIEIWGDPQRILETCSIGDFLRIIDRTLLVDIDGGLYNIGSGGTTLEERVRGIVEVFCHKGNVSRISYAPDKKSTTQFVLDISKTKSELGYIPKDTWRDYLIQFKNEMDTQPFGALWGFERDFMPSL